RSAGTAPAATGGAGADRRPAGYSHRRAQTYAAGRRGGGHGVLGWRRGTHGRSRGGRGAGGAARSGPHGTHPPVPPLLDGRAGRHAEALRRRGRFPDAAHAYEQAMELVRSKGDVISLARATTGYVITLQELGDPRARTLHAEALALVEPLGISPELVQALGDE